ncbi:MAG: MerR family transcriptional regulator [Clostridia bacterium]|jgi:DNA-binding transcriptional MerR regulator
MKKESIQGLIKIGGISKATGTSVTTLKFYIKEGLIHATCKTGPNMAYYDPDCIAKVKLIKSMQKEHYYPLSVIRNMMGSSETDHLELELMDAIHKVDYRNSIKTYSLTDVMKMTGLVKSQIDMLKQHDIINPDVSGMKQIYTDSDLQILFLIKRRLEAGIPFDQSIESFMIYMESIRKAANADIDSFITQALLPCSPTTLDATHMIGVSDETLDKFISIKRNELNRKIGSERVEQLNCYSMRLLQFLDRISTILKEEGHTGYAVLLHDAILTFPTGEGRLTVALQNYNLLIESSKKSLARSITVVQKAHAYFISPDNERDMDMDSFILYTLRLGWLFLTPPLLRYDKEADKVMKDYRSYADRCVGKRIKEITDKVLYFLHDLKASV